MTPLKAEIKLVDSIQQMKGEGTGKRGEKL
jgi:hypothetical protein